jgi:hypothetical protein
VVGRDAFIAVYIMAALRGTEFVVKLGGSVISAGV